MNTHLLRHLLLNRTLVLCSILGSMVASAQELSPTDLVAQLQAGGKVIVMRHASSPRATPDAASASEGNDSLERQLDQQGREQAAQFGAALSRLQISISTTHSSPTFRALETARYAGLASPVAYEELSNAGMREAGAEKAAWLREQTTLAPTNSNKLLITHNPNISAAFPDAGSTSEGEALVFDPLISTTVPVGRITIDAWPNL